MGRNVREMRRLLEPREWKDQAENREGNSHDRVRVPGPEAFPAHNARGDARADRKQSGRECHNNPSKERVGSPSVTERLTRQLALHGTARRPGGKTRTALELGVALCPGSAYTRLLRGLECKKAGGLEAGSFDNVGLCHAGWLDAPWALVPRAVDPRWDGYAVRSSPRYGTSSASSFFGSCTAGSSQRSKSFTSRIAGIRSCSGRKGQGESRQPLTNPNQVPGRPTAGHCKRCATCAR